MNESDDSKDLSDSISKLQPKTDFCLFCNGTGKLRDDILLREDPCTHCEGKGE